MLKEVVQQAVNDAGSDEILHLEYVVDGVAMVSEVGDLALEAIELTELFGPWQAVGIATGTIGVLAGYVGFWLQLGGAHAEAMNEIAGDHVKRGVSYGAVLGANGAGPHYTYDNFWLQVAPNLPVYPEFEKRAQNLQNAGLVVGYSEGKKLSSDEMQEFYRDIRSRMDAADQDYYDFTSTPFKEWSEEKKRDFYIASAAIFRGAHLEGS